jgi:hypothetical protein
MSEFEEIIVRRRDDKIEVLEAPLKAWISEALLVDADPAHLWQEDNTIWIKDDYGLLAEYKITGISDFGRIYEVERMS